MDGSLLKIDADQFLPELYRRVLGREADPPGLMHFARILASGTSRGEVIADVLMSDEANLRRGARIDRFGRRIIRKARIAQSLPEGVLRLTTARLLGLSAPGDRGFDWQAWSGSLPAARANDEESGCDIPDGEGIEQGRESGNHYASHFRITNSEAFVNYLVLEDCLPRLDCERAGENIRFAKARITVNGQAVLYGQIVGETSQVHRLIVRMDGTTLTGTTIWDDGRFAVKEYLFLVHRSAVNPSTGINLDLELDSVLNTVHIEIYEEVKDKLVCASFPTYDLIRVNLPMDVSIGTCAIIGAEGQAIGFDSALRGVGNLIRVSASGGISWVPSKRKFKSYELDQGRLSNFIMDANFEQVVRYGVEFRPDIPKLVQTWQKLGDGPFIRMLYEQILHRDSDEGGYQSVSKTFQEGLTTVGAEYAIRNLWRMFTGSTEFRSKPVRYIAKELLLD